ncbi:MAG: HEAT repeat domain-containing protein [Nitrospiraceae bacterium]
MTKEKLSGSREQNILSSTTLGSAMNWVNVEFDKSSSAGESTATPSKHFHDLTPTSLRDFEIGELLLALSSMISEGNWSWLGNFSGCKTRELRELLKAYLGNVYSGESTQDRPASSTAITLEPQRNLTGKIENLFSLGRNEIFEDGTESYLSRELIALVRRHGNIAIVEIARLITSEKVDACVAAEALKWLGRIQHLDTHLFRRGLLLRALTASSVVVREGAVLGLAFMNDPATISPLQQALDREQIPELRDDLSQVLQQLHNVH